MSKQQERKPHTIYFDDPSLTVQHFKDECDINIILGRADKTGVITHINEARAIYGDFSKITSYQEHFAELEKAEALFMSLPAEMRKDMDNDPSQLEAYIADNKNTDKLVALGVLEKSKPSLADEIVEGIDRVSKRSPKPSGSTTGAKPDGE